jgi:hypothetical protein
MADSAHAPKVEVFGETIVGGTSISRLEERVQHLEVLLKAQASAQPHDRLPDNNIPTSGDGVLPNQSIDSSASDSIDPIPRELIKEETKDLEGKADTSYDKNIDTRNMIFEPELRVDRGRPIVRPTFTRMSRRYLSLEALDRHKVPFQVDEMVCHVFFPTFH